MLRARARGDSLGGTIFDFRKISLVLPRALSYRAIDGMEVPVNASVDEETLAAQKLNERKRLEKMGGELSDRQGIGKWKRNPAATKKAITVSPKWISVWEAVARRVAADGLEWRDVYSDLQIPAKQFALLRIGQGGLSAGQLLNVVLWLGTRGVV